MRYFVNGREVTQSDVERRLLAEMRAAERSRYFPGRIFYNLDYIEHSARATMRVTGETTYAWFDLQLVEEKV